MSEKPTRLEDIAAQLQGYDPKALPVEQVHTFLQRMVAPIEDTEDLPIFQALDRVLAQDIVSPISVPPHNNSAMDGYAFDGAILANSTGEVIELTIVGRQLAGDIEPATVDTIGAGTDANVANQTCIQITTGAVMPEAFDTVVPIEWCTVVSTDTTGPTIRFAKSAVAQGDNRRLLGEDLMQGHAALRAGHRLGPAALGLIASLGLGTVKVRRRLKVAYFSTGNEILSIGQAPQAGAVYDSNRYTLFGLLSHLGVDIIDMGVVRDDPTALKAAFTQASGQADAIITSGGVSVGEADHTKQVMRELGDVAFWRIAMRPGRPMAVGRLGNTVLFGLPGNPVAVMVTFLALVRPALLTMMGATIDPSTPYAAPTHTVISADALPKKPGRTEYLRGIVLRNTDGQLVVRTTGNQGSGVLRSMAEANCLIVLPHNSGPVKSGEAVSVLMFEGLM